MRPRIIRMRLADPGALLQWVFVFFGYGLLSTAYGYWNLDGMDKLTLNLTTGNSQYLRVAIDRLLQLLLGIVAFCVVRNSHHSKVQLMHWWLQGLTVTVLLHVLTYVITGETLLQRAGTFNEGNLAGLYYLLSLLVALEYRRMTSSKAANRFLVVAFC